ncbi:MAG: hypothetical protein AAGG50_02170 [Bacteroidota bacterium]
MLSLLVSLTAVLALAPDSSVVLQERIDLFDPTTGQFLGTEQTYFDANGHRLRLEVSGADGALTLLYFVLRDPSGREEAAVYFEGDEPTATRTAFDYDDAGRLRTSTYSYEPGVTADRTEAVLDDAGRDIQRRYFRADGSQYGVEDVLWNDDGTQHGWDFRRLRRDGTPDPDRVTSYRYAYRALDEASQWSVRTRSRKGQVERLEARTVTTATDRVPFVTAAPFALGTISTEQSETSPSFSRDGRTMVFARYVDWGEKTAFIADLTDAGWAVEAIPDIGPVYNLAVTPDGDAVVYAAGPAGPLMRVARTPDGWLEPENLTDQYDIQGGYASFTDAGDLVVYRSDGPEGDGIYLAPKSDDGFGPATALYVPDEGTTFDAIVDGQRLFVTRCFDDVCAPGSSNGVWEVTLDVEGGPSAQKMPALPYVWGVQIVEALGLFVYTDGEDILAVPLSTVEQPSGS